MLNSRQRLALIALRNCRVIRASHRQADYAWLMQLGFATRAPAAPGPHASADRYWHYRATAYGLKQLERS